MCDLCLSIPAGVITAAMLKLALLLGLLLSSTLAHPVCEILAVAACVVALAAKLCLLADGPGAETIRSLRLQLRLQLQQGDSTSFLLRPAVLQKFLLLLLCCVCADGPRF